MRSDDRTTESTAVTVRDNNNQELVDLLTLGEGPLAAGAQPAIQAANDAGRAALAQSLQNDETTVAVKKKEGKGRAGRKGRTNDYPRVPSSICDEVIQNTKITKLQEVTKVSFFDVLDFIPRSFTNL